MKERQEKILFLIVEDFIKTSIPIASARVKKIGNFTCGSATIRNEMQFLEKIDMLEKPHTSGGRIPTTKGYRYYLEHSKSGIEFINLEKAINNLFENRSDSIDLVIEQASALIADLLDSPVALFRRKKILKGSRIQSIQVFKVSPNRVMLTIISNEEILFEKVVDIPDEYFEDLKFCLAIISKRLFNAPLDELIDRLEAILPILEQHINYFESYLKDLVLEMFRNALIKVNVYGAPNLIKAKEFQNNDMLIQIIDLLDERNIWKLLEKQFEEIPGTSTKLGYLNNKNFSVMSIGLDNKVKLAVIGPKRANYLKIMAALELIKRNSKQRKGMIGYIREGRKNEK